MAGDDVTIWDDPTLAVSSDSAHRRKYRQLQSWFRATQLEAPAGHHQGRPVGSRLDELAVERQPDLNFLWPAAALHADVRVEAVRRQGGSLDPERLRGNLLSSMPLCFNLFGALGTHPAFIEIVRRCFAPDAVRIVAVECEHAPQPPWLFLSDRTAFDALVVFERDDASLGFVGIETKYTEPFSPEAYRTDRYDVVTQHCGWFRDGAADRLVTKATNQLWRNTMLAAALEAHGRFGTGRVAVVCTGDDAGAARAVEGVRDELVDPDRLQLVTLDDIIDAARATGDADLDAWADRFERRYVDLDAPDRQPTAPPLGLRQGRTLVAPPRRGAAAEELDRSTVHRLSWQIAARLLAADGDLRLYETHPGGGLYDCLSLRRGPDLVIDLNQAGSIHVHQPPWKWETPWAEIDRVGADWAAALVAHHSGLAERADHEGPNPQAAAAGHLAELLAAHRDAGLTATSAFCDSSGPGGSSLRDDVVVAFADAPPFRDRRSDPPTADEVAAWLPLFAIERGAEPIALVDIDKGRWWRPGSPADHDLALEPITDVMQARRR